VTGKAKGKRILVIDDHPLGAESFSHLLRLFGHEVEMATTGDEGLGMIRKLRPDVVFCDWRLPGMSGDEVARAVRSEPAIASTYLVSLTAYDDEYTRQRAMEAGFDLHLVKPPEIAALKKLLEGPLSATRTP
jgi:CheY-like chemotaxis protein